MILNAHDYASDQTEVVNFNEGAKLETNPTAIVGMNIAGLSMLMDRIKQTRLMIISKRTDEVSIPLVEAYHSKTKFRALQFLILQHHYRVSNVYRDKVLEDQWFLRDVWTFKDVSINNMQARLPDQAHGHVDKLLLDLTGAIEDRFFQGAGKAMGSNIDNLPKN